jgi:hypothetical protein
VKYSNAAMSTSHPSGDCTCVKQLDFDQAAHYGNTGQWCSDTFTTSTGDHDHGLRPLAWRAVAAGQVWCSRARLVSTRARCRR